MMKRNVIPPTDAGVNESELLFAISGLVDAITDYEKTGHEVPFTAIETRKIEVANEFLRLLGIDPNPEEFTPTEPPRERPLPKQGFVYLAKNHRNGFHKIGWSKRPKIREATLQSQEPEVSFIAIGKGTRALEIALHVKYAEFRLRGEWFDLIPPHVQEIVEMLGGRP